MFPATGPLSPHVFNAIVFSRSVLPVADPVGITMKSMLIEGFNITNHVNLRPPFGNPPGAGAQMIAPAFLVRTNAHAARQVQWGIRFAF